MKNNSLPSEPFATSLLDLPFHPPLVEVEPLLQQALREDISGGDWTAQLTIPAGQEGIAFCHAKEPFVLCGLLVAQQVFAQVDRRVQFQPLAGEGERVEAKQKIFQVQGVAHSLLAGERVALNFLQHLSGVATEAYRYAAQVEGTGVRVVDTRKTIPGLRALQKYAVRVGGCFNHRASLHTGVLIKENHIRAAGSVQAAVQRARRQAPHTLRVEVEVTSLAELEEALQAGAEAILLDNMELEQLRQAVARTEGAALLEASGGISLENVRAVAETGVDLVSVGALTHSSKAADMSMTFLQEP